MQTVLKDKVISVEDYMLLEESSEVRHEFINGNLYEMSGASDTHIISYVKTCYLFSGLY